MFNTPNIVGLIKAAAGTSDNNVPVYQAPPGSAPHERIFSAMNDRAATPTQNSTTDGDIPKVSRSQRATSPRTGSTSAAQPVEDVDENGMPISLDSPEAMAESADMVRRMQNDMIDVDENGMPVSLDPPWADAESADMVRRLQKSITAPTTRPTATRPSVPARPATPNPHAFRNITAADMRRFRRFTGATNMNSEMDKWKTWQAMLGNRNASNADFYKARSRGFR